MDSLRPDRWAVKESLGKIASILLSRHGLVLKDFKDVKEIAFTHIRTEPPRDALPPCTAFPKRTAVPPSAGGAGSNVIHTKPASVTVLLLARDSDLLSLRLGPSPSMLQHCPVREKTTGQCGEDDEEDAKASVLARV